MDNFLAGFKKRISKKEIKIAVVGLGYVGLPLAIEFAKRGLCVLGIEIDKDRLLHIKNRESYITDVPGEELKKVLASGKFKAYGDFSAVKEADAVIICVPTPLKRKYHPDISYIKQAVRSISEHIKKKALVILESTTYPGTTEEVILPLLQRHGLKHGEDFYLSFSPERIDPGNKDYPVHKIPKIVGGINKEAGELAVAVYKNIIERVVPVSSARAAETAKLLENTFRLINIGLIDELAMMCHKMKIDIWEVIDAAKTKPFGFMPFYPGPGVGGHCLDKNETLCVKDGNSLKVMRMPEFIKHIENVKDKNVEILSFDPLKRKSIFKEVVAASARPYSGQMIDILTEDGRRLKVTDLHPMFVYNDKRWRLKYAKDLQKGDNLPVFLNLPSFDNGRNLGIEIDILKEIRQKAQDLIGKIRVKPLDFFWRDYAEEIKLILRKEHKDRLPDACWDYLSENYLPLKYFYELEKLTKVDCNRVKLETGRGPGVRGMPAKIILDDDFFRLIGYYLSEGCYTKDKSARIRFTFNRSEKEYIEDVLGILSRLGIKASVYESKVWHSSCIKVSSDLFGFLINDVLACGKNCYEMRMPEQIFSLDKEKKKALLSGLLRGDGCVEHFFGKWRYRKNQKEYFHNVNTASVSFFTSSRKLFQQAVILLQDLGITPTFRKRKYALSIFGYKQLSYFKDLFAGKKKEIIERYLELNKNRPKNKTFKRFGDFVTVKVKSVSSAGGDWVYSVETKKPHTFITSYGIAVHNCIPKDPLYLFWKAKHHGFRSRFIKLASDVIDYMPGYVVERVVALASHQVTKSPSHPLKILVAGVTYKKDIKDLRKSPPLDIIDICQKRGIDVSYYDPLIPYLKINDINLKSVDIKKKGLLEAFDCVIIATDHSDTDYKFILKNAKLIFDTRNVYKGITSSKIVRL